MNKHPFLLIDADVLAYQAAAGAEKIICFEEDTCLPVCSLIDAKALFESKLTTILEALGTEDFILAFSDSSDNNFRRGIYPQYKMNRAGKPRPVALAYLRQSVMEDYAEDQVYLRPTLEADDCMGILATQKAFQHGRQKVIVTIDKDLKSIPGYFYDIGKPELGIQAVTLEDADYWHMTQSLIGDTADGYPGCPKVGPVAAEKLFKDSPRTYKALWPLVLAAYDKAGFGEEYALTQARVARILRAEDYDFKNKQVKLWKP